MKKNPFPHSPRPRLAMKLALFILSSTSLIFAIAFTYNYNYTKRTVLRTVEDLARHLTRSTIHRIETVINGVEIPPQFLASYAQQEGTTNPNLPTLLTHFVKTNEEIYGGTIAYEPYTYQPDVLYHSPYYYKDNGKIAFTQLGTEAYNYFGQDWYLIPKELNSPQWSEPYYDEGGGNIIMSTYSVPFYRNENGQPVFTGIVTADISLEWLVDLVSSISLYQRGYAFLVSQNGVFVTHPRKNYIMRESIFSISEALEDPNLRQIGHNMIKGYSGFAPYQSSYLKQKAWMYYAPIPSTKWSIGVVIPEEELFADVEALFKEVSVIGISGFILLFLVVILISGSITKPIRTLARTTSEIAKGNLDIELPMIKSNDEVGDLTKSFENMRVALKEYIHDLTETTAAKERIESELKIAHTIQMNFLPKKFPPFPEKDQFDLFAHLEPAKEVGGDLYDFFLLDDNHLFISIGDVSGKGVPAALFMAVTKTLMKGTADLHTTPAELLMKVNNELAQDNESSMFVTVFCGILNIQTGELCYSNAAHNRPVLIRRGQAPQWLDLPKGFLLGPMMDMDFDNQAIVLQPGDELITYTDGVSEAMNPQQELYSDARLLETVGRLKGKSSQEHVEELLQSIRDHALEEPQSDDITILALRYHGHKKS
ncbi:MAG: SpoIIE family protein phosphatase [bacterium]|jgi:sigma-B regulation protein RsbU (phosphoserine phosphatase)|nr:SpoIIE family protein phosphatase [bacterium]